MDVMISRREFIGKSGLAFGGLLLSAQWNSKLFARRSNREFDSVRFGIMADLHLDTKTENGMKMSAHSTACLKHTVDDLNREKDLNFVIVLGDLLLDGELENAKIVRENLKRLKMPAYVICGNHDFAPADESKRRVGFHYLKIDQFVEYFRDFGYGEEQRRYYAREILPGLRVIGLDACLPEAKTDWGGILPKAQLQWLDRQLSENADALNVIFMHHNFVRWGDDELPGGEKEDFCIDNDREVRRLLAKHRVPVVFSGHRHIGLNVKTEKDVNYFTVPSINSYPMRYSVFDITLEKINWKTPMVSLPAPVHVEARKNLLAADWWRNSQYRQPSVENDKKVLDFYENNKRMIDELKFS